MENIATQKTESFIYVCILVSLIVKFNIYILWIGCFCDTDCKRCVSDTECRFTSLVQ